MRVHKLSIKSLEGRNIAIETKANPVQIETATETATTATETETATATATITTPGESLSNNITDQSDSGIRKIRYPDLTLSPIDDFANLEIENRGIHIGYPNISSVDTTYCSILRGTYL